MIFIVAIALLGVGYLSAILMSVDLNIPLEQEIKELKIKIHNLEYDLADANRQISDLKEVAACNREKYAAIDDVIYEYYCNTNEVS